jgi:hypothetical protein
MVGTGLNNVALLRSVRGEGTNILAAFLLGGDGKIEGYSAPAER